MFSKLKSAAHLLPLVLVFLAGLGAFLILRAALVPKDFGQYGHYRPAALDDSASGLSLCGTDEPVPTCHDDVTTARAAGGHKGVSCEACHGPLAKHADDTVGPHAQAPGGHRAMPALPRSGPGEARRVSPGCIGRALRRRRVPVVP